MLKKLFLLFVFAYSFCTNASAQEYFTIKDYGIDVKVNKDASLDVTENILVHFTEPRHGIFRMIPFQYQQIALPDSVEKAQQQLSGGGFTRTIIENIKVDKWNFETSTSGDYIQVKIGSANTTVDGDQTYIIHYSVLNAINFFTDYSELYFNLIGDQWPVRIDSVHFRVTLQAALNEIPRYFVATGNTGSRENNTVTNWENNEIFSGTTTTFLNPRQGVTIGIAFPKDFLTAPNYEMRGFGWLALPLAGFVGMFLLWKAKGKDEKRAVQTEFYPPEGISPSVAGYFIDNTLDTKDLTALIPYWGANGYLQINETEKKSLAGLIKTTEYEFIKIKGLPPQSPDFEKTLFNGIFKTGSKVKLDDLKNVLYSTMSTAKSQLEADIKREDYFVKGSRNMGCLLPGLGFLILVTGVILLAYTWYDYKWLGISVLLFGLPIMIFVFLMSKRSEKGTDLYYHLLGFKEFIKSVEKDKLNEFLKQDAHYFDKVLPFAIVFGMASVWKDKLKGLDIPPPSWYNGTYNSGVFNSMLFMNSINNSMSAMSSTFTSSPSSSGSSGGSFGGGGFSGGGGGGGGGGSW
ncbi:MAG: DUF2207 domain-containing protein [Chitinophagaceae bacterium]